jgi:hypothetical protein
MKASTTTFYSYVSLYIPTKGQRLTLGVFPVKKGVSKVEYIRKFLAIIHDLDVNIAVLCLDRGFYSNDVFSFLQSENIPHIVPVKIREGTHETTPGQSFPVCPLHDDGNRRTS